MAAAATAAKTAPGGQDRSGSTAGAAPHPSPAPAREPAPGVHLPLQRRRIMAGAAMVPVAAARTAGAVTELSDSSLIMRLTRGRGWIAVLCALLSGIVALNVVSLSLNAGAGRTSFQIDALKTENSALRGQIAERLSATRVEDAAANLGLANPSLARSPT